ncbi:unannotated protein [freshwater metagenome]|uniref:Unannotated protein n=1 Tax=freshwater metagenome TaxID=449393 RepID=A0A6J6BVS1_9ZZZZ
MDAFNAAPCEQFETALDEHFLGERVAHLNGWTFGWTALSERIRGEDGCSADSVATCAGSEKNHEVTDSLRVCEVQVFVTQGPYCQSVDEWVRLIHGVEPCLSANVRQPETIPVERDTTHDTVDDTTRVGVVDCAETQCVHDGNGTSAHRNDVANDSTDAGRGALERLNVGRVVVALDLEGDRPALADIDNSGVFAHSDHEILGHRLGDLLAELTQVNLRRLV